MTIKPGDRIPSMTLTRAGPDGPEPVQTDDYFAGRKIALFSVPGAFTPTCSARHLPGYIERADELKAKGVDEIACVSVNDAFVLGAWAKQAGAEGKVTMLADGNGDFAEALGLAGRFLQIRHGQARPALVGDRRRRRGDRAQRRGAGRVQRIERRIPVSAAVGFFARRRGDAERPALSLPLRVSASPREIIYWRAAGTERGPEHFGGEAVDLVGEDQEVDRQIAADEAVIGGEVALQRRRPSAVT